MFGLKKINFYKKKKNLFVSNTPKVYIIDTFA